MCHNYTRFDQTKYNKLLRAPFFSGATVPLSKATVAFYPNGPLEKVQRIQLDTAYLPVTRYSYGLYNHGLYSYGL